VEVFARILFGCCVTSRAEIFYQNMCAYFLISCILDPENLLKEINAELTLNSNTKKIILQTSKSSKSYIKKCGILCPIMQIKKQLTLKLNLE